MPPAKHAPTLAELRARRGEILRAAAAHDAHNIRVFGSVARGDADEQSDVDFLVDIETSAVGFAYFGLLEDLRRTLEDLLGYTVDIADSAAFRCERPGYPSMRERVMREAVQL